jgi:AraC family transcriptional regulator
MPELRSVLFDNELLRIPHVVSRPESDACGDLACFTADTLVLPVAGMFAKHDGPRRLCVVNSNHGLFIERDRPFRISYPARIGDECISLAFQPSTLAGLLNDVAGVEHFAALKMSGQCLLPPAAAVHRTLLWHGLKHGRLDRVEVEEVSVLLLAVAVRTGCADARRKVHAQRAATSQRRRAKVEAVKEAIGARPGQNWSLSSLAHVANASPYHLTRIFNDEVGTPLHRYLVRTRLHQCLHAMFEGNADITEIALDAGFAGASHFGASFRAYFGATPSELRRRTDSQGLRELRKNLISPTTRPA